MKLLALRLAPASGIGRLTLACTLAAALSAPLADASDPTSGPLVINLTDTFPAHMPRIMHDPGYNPGHAVAAFHRHPTDASTTLHSLGRVERQLDELFLGRAGAPLAETLWVNNCSSARNSIGSYLAYRYGPAGERPLFESIVALSGLARAVPVRGPNRESLLAITTVVQQSDGAFRLAPQTHYLIRAGEAPVPMAVEGAHLTTAFNATLYQDSQSGHWFYATQDGRRVEANLDYVQRILGRTLHDQPLVIPNMPLPLLSGGPPLDAADLDVQKALISRVLEGKAARESAQWSSEARRAAQTACEIPDGLGAMLQILRRVQ